MLSKWPTYPQLYVNGSLVGGLDVVRELKEEGELEETLKYALGCEHPGGDDDGGYVDGGDGGDCGGGAFCVVHG